MRKGLFSGVPIMRIVVFGHPYTLRTQESNFSKHSRAEDTAQS